jgi:hypothetical protein
VVLVGVVGDCGVVNVLVLDGKKANGLLVVVKGVLDEVCPLKVMGDWLLFVWRVMGSVWILKGWF